MVEVLDKPMVPSAREFSAFIAALPDPRHADPMSAPREYRSALVIYQHELENSTDPEFIRPQVALQSAFAHLQELRAEPGKIETPDQTCPKCHGTGKVDRYQHVMDGVCFACNGTGKKLSDAAVRRITDAYRRAAQNQKKIPTPREITGSAHPVPTHDY